MVEIKHSVETLEDKVEEISHSILYKLEGLSIKREKLECQRANQSIRPNIKIIEFSEKVEKVMRENHHQKTINTLCKMLKIKLFTLMYKLCFTLMYKPTGN